MDIPQVICRWPGVDRAGEFQIAFGYGIRPEIHTLEIPKSLRSFASRGTLQALDSRGRALVMPYCRLRAVVQLENGWQRLLIEDRRHFWQFGKIDGDYNYLNKDSNYVREKSPRELATLLLEAMLETNFDVQALPNGPRPRKQWNAANPASELETLAAQYGCVVALNPVTDTVKLCKLATTNQNQQLPQGGIITRLPYEFIPPMPSEIRIVAGVILWQTTFTLGDSLGREVSGELKKLNDLSYKPQDDGGWNRHSPVYFDSIKGEHTVNGRKIFNRDLAADSVWRFHKLGRPISGSWCPPQLQGSEYEPQGLDDYGPWLTTRLEKDTQTGGRNPIAIRGDFYADSQDLKNVPSGTIFPYDARILPEGILQTAKPLYRIQDADEGAFYKGDIRKADVTITVGHAVKVKGVPIRYEKWLNNNNSEGPVGPQLEYHEEIVREIIQEDSVQGGMGGGPAVDNLAKVDAQADYYLQACAAKLQESTGETIQYTGLEVSVHLDGAVRRLSWSGGPKTAPSTTVALYLEPNPFKLPYEQSPAQVAKRIAEQRTRQENWKKYLDQRSIEVL